MDREHDVIIVGAGPAGAACAISLAREHGIRALVLDRARFPRPKTCAGGLSPGAREALEHLGVWSRVEPLAHHVDRARIEAMWGGSYSVCDTADGWVLPRQTLDSILADEVRSLGVDLEEASRVMDVRARPGRPTQLVVKTRQDETTMSGRWVVLAGGAHMGRRLHLARGRLLHSLLARYEGVVHDRRCIELIFDEQLYPHYGWVFPEPDGLCNVGLCVEDRRLDGRTVRELFESFVRRRLGPRMDGARMIHRPRGHPILAAPVPNHAARPGLLLTGEAACLVNPVTGEGIGPALRSGIIAAQTLSRALSGDLSDDEAASSYRRQLRRQVAPSLMVGELLRVAGVRALDFVFDNTHWLFGGRRILRAAMQL